MDDKQKEIIASRFERVPRLRIGYYPTPLEKMARLSEALGGGPRLFIKRDDYTGAGFGGNKVRKLDYMLAQAVADAGDVVITIGGEKSNHARVTAAMCARLGLRCILVLNRAAQTGGASLKPASLVVDEMVGAEIHLVDSREERRSRATEIAAQLREQGKRVLAIPLGASVPLGALGFVRAMREVMAQFAEIGVRPTHIFHSSSSGGTQAGLFAGLQLFVEEDINIIGVSPDDPADDITASVAEIVNGIHQLLKTDEDKISPAQVQVLDQYIGEGYGIESPAGIAAAKLLAAREGIILDPTYTAKAFAALLDWIEDGKLTEKDTVLFWHTGGQLAYFYMPE
jgi:L-cysteate sulfo-lyase